MNTGTERDVEIPWLIENCIKFPVLDVGCRESVYLGDLGGEVQGIDVREMKRDGLNAFWRGDIRTWKHYRTFPTIAAISTLEHVGLAVKSYETQADDVEHGARRAVEGCMRNLDTDGVMLMTVPFGEQRTYDWYRSFDSDGLAALLDGFDSEIETVMNDAWKVKGVALCKVRHAQ